MGNYRDVLREVGGSDNVILFCLLTKHSQFNSLSAYSPMMAEMLSYLESKSSEFVWKEHKQVQFADENFAREIMQLFSIGLIKLNIDGTARLDSTGKPIATYNNDDITEYARVWTGFRR